MIIPRNIFLIFLAMLLVGGIGFFPRPVYAAISVGTPTSNSCDCNQLTISNHNISGTDRFVVVLVSLDDPTGSKNVSTMTYNGISMTKLDEANSNTLGGAAKEAAEVWYLSPGSNPSDGNYNVVITISGGNAQKMTANAFTLTGVDQTTPVDTGTVQKAAAKSSAPSVSVTSATGDLVMDILSTQDTTNPSVGAGQTQRANYEIGGSGTSGHYGGVSTEPGATSVTMSWSTGNQFMVIIGFNINQAVGVTIPTVGNVGAVPSVSSALLFGSIGDTGGENASEVGFAYGTDPDLSTNTATTTELGDFSTSFSVKIDTLFAGVTYYFRAYAINSAGTGYAPTISNFTTGTDTSVVRKLRIFEGFTIRVISTRVILHQN